MHTLTRASHRKRLDCAFNEGNAEVAHLEAVRPGDVARGKATPLHRRHEEEVILMHSGRLTVSLPDGDVELAPGDVLTVPLDMARRYSNTTHEPVEAWVVRGGDQPGAPTYDS